MSSINFQACFNNISPQDKLAIISFWKNSGLSNTLDFDEEQRLKQIGFIAKNSSNEVIGVSSYYLDIDEYLNAPFYYLRAAVAKKNQKSGIAAQLVDKMTRQLEKVCLEKNDTSVKGAVIVYENPSLQKFFNGAVVESPTFYFYAIDKKNCPRRVHYFKNAKIVN